jgi:outer membrane murein-binding lipoprotein Lpp
MKTKSMVWMVLAAMSIGFVAAGCRSEAKVDEDGAKLEIKDTD